MSRIRTQLHSPVLCVVDKVTLFQTRLKENTENILTTSLLSTEHFDGIGHIVLKVRSDMMTLFCLKSQRATYIN